MPIHILTNPTLPDQPYPFEVREGDEIPAALVTAGWVDSGPAPEPAPEEAAAPDVPVDQAESTTETTPPEQADNPLDLTKED